MGQKVSPHGLRVGVIKDWDSKWYADKKNFADYLIEDNKVRENVKKKFQTALSSASFAVQSREWTESRKSEGMVPDARINFRTGHGLQSVS